MLYVRALSDVTVGVACARIGIPVVNLDDTRWDRPPNYFNEFPVHHYPLIDSHRDRGRSMKSFFRRRPLHSKVEGAYLWECEQPALWHPLKTFQDMQAVHRCVERRSTNITHQSLAQSTLHAAVAPRAETVGKTLPQQTPQHQCDKAGGVLGTHGVLACCSSSCSGQCGGAGCASLPGGKANCCARPIEASGRVCVEGTNAPCMTKRVMKNAGEISASAHSSKNTPTLNTRAPAAGPCDGNWVFIIATGRSGSTTVLDMLNLVPSIELSGEKGSSFCGLWSKMYADQRQILLDSQAENPAFLSVASGLQRTDAANRTDLAVSHSMCTWLKGIEPRSPTKAFVMTHGFKEIRPCYVPLLKRAFPHAKFILNYREDVEAQSHSQGFAAMDSAHAVQYIEVKAETYRQELRGSETFDLPLESFNVSTFNRLLQWLGIDDCTYRGVLHSNAHGYRIQRNQDWAIHCAPAFGGDYTDKMVMPPKKMQQMSAVLKNKREKILERQSTQLAALQRHHTEELEKAEEDTPLAEESAGHRDARSPPRLALASAFVVFSMQRSASSTLINMIENLNQSLNQSVVPNLFEVLNPGQFPPTRPMLPEWWRSHGTAGFTHGQVMHHLPKFMARFWSWCPLPTCGFKVFHDHVREPGKLQDLFYDGGRATRIIILKRQNITAQVRASIPNRAKAHACTLTICNAGWVFLIIRG